MRIALRAYTFIEMLIVIAIIAIFSAIALPSLKNIIERNQETLLQSSLLRMLHLAKREAIAKGMPIAICNSNNVMTCEKTGKKWLVFVDENEDGQIQDKQNIISIFAFDLRGGKLNWRAYPSYRDYLRFLPKQWTLTDNGLFWFCRAKQKIPIFAIAINKAGEVHAIYPDGNGKIKDGDGKVLGC